MGEIKSYPYLTPSAAAIVIRQEWQLYDDELIVEPAQFLSTWNPALMIEAEIVLSVDLDVVLRECQLSNDARLRVVTGWRSSGTMLRGNGQSADVLASNSNQDIRLRVEADGRHVLHDVFLFAGLILVSVGSTANPLAPRLPGAILWQNEKRLVLNAVDLQFPTEIVNFSERSWPVPEYAAWYLQWDPTDLHQLVFGDVRLYLNSRHPLVLGALSGNQNVTDTMQNFVFFDLARTLIRGALSNPEFVADPNQFPEDTIGAVIRDILAHQFPDYSVKALHTMLADPALFEAYLQHHLNFLRG